MCMSKTRTANGWPEGVDGISRFHEMVGAHAEEPAEAAIGIEPNRYANAKCRKDYAGTSPITRASGTKRIVLARYARNMRLADAIYQWSFASLTASPGARAFYDYRRAAGDTHHAALRHLGNRLVGTLHGCLLHHTAYNENTAWGHRTELELSRAA
jgi:hypothetical protein